jgi:thiamine pyrophosphokinase
MLHDKVNDSVLLILNQPLPNIEIFLTLWKNSSIHIVADGGANQLYHTLKTLYLESAYIPDIIIGDLDSITTDVIDFYNSKSVTILQDNNQNKNDFQKCVSHKCITPKQTIFVLGGLSGRLDHIMASLDILLQYSHLNIICTSLDSLAICLQPGAHEIHVDSFQGPTCGFFPLHGIAICSTKGLQWNVDDTMPLQFGGLVSTSNKFDPSSFNETLGCFVLHIETNIPIIWTTELQHFK